MVLIGGRKKLERAAQDALARAEAAEASANEAEQRAKQAQCARSWPRPSATPRSLARIRLSGSAMRRWGKPARQRPHARLPSSRPSARKDTERAEHQAAAGLRRAEQAEARATDAAARAEQQARSERAQLEREFDAQRKARETAELERSEAQTALEAAQRLRSQLEAEVAASNERLEAAEQARDAAIAARAEGAPPAPTPPAANADPARPYRLPARWRNRPAREVTVAARPGASTCARALARAKGAAAVGAQGARSARCPGKPACRRFTSRCRQESQRPSRIRSAHHMRRTGTG
jgi:hypothetical protein